MNDDISNRLIAELSSERQALVKQAEKFVYIYEGEKHPEKSLDERLMEAIDAWIKSIEKIKK